MPRLPDNYIPQVPNMNVPTYGAPVTRDMPPVEGIEPPEDTGTPGYQFPRVDLPLIYPTEPVIGAGNTRENEKEEEEEEEDEDREMKDDEIPMRPFDAATFIEVPVVGQIPVPKPEVVITAGTTAVVATVGATGAAVFAKPMFDQVMKLMKPLVKKLIAKILKKKTKDYSKVPTTPAELPALSHFYTRRRVPSQSHPDKDQRKESSDEETLPPE